MDTIKINNCLTWLNIPIAKNENDVLSLKCVFKCWNVSFFEMCVNNVVVNSFRGLFDHKMLVLLQIEMLFESMII